MPVPIARLRELIELAASAGVETIDIVENGTRIRISRNGSGPTPGLEVPAPHQSPPLPVAQSEDIFVSPMFGVLHMAPAADARPYVQAGDQVIKGQQICLIEAMKMFNAIYSDRSGRLEEILATTGCEIVAGQPLFRIVGG